MIAPQVLQLNERGQPVTWLNVRDAIKLKAKGRIVHQMGDHDWTKYGGYSRMTGERSSVHFASIVFVRGNFVPKRSTPPLSNPNLFRRDLNICAYCGNQQNDSKLTRDHIVPKSRGGKNLWTNCVTACKRCNNYKGDYMLEHIGLKLLYVPYAPCREEGLILRGKKILADQMEFLQASLPAHSRHAKH